jgi:glycosyltransferase involved in cell wall biosynthesis
MSEPDDHGATAAGGRRHHSGPPAGAGDGDAVTVLLLAPAGSLHTRRWVAALARAGHRVVVASWQPAEPLPAGELRVAPTRAIAGIRLPLARTWLRRLIREVQPDLVHVHSLGVHGLLALALPPGPPRVVTPWGSELRAARRSAAKAAVIRLAVSRADLVLPTSAEVAAEMMDRYAVPAARTRVLSWGVADELIAALSSVRPAAVRAAYGIPAGATMVLSIRSTSATYRTREVASAFAQAASVRRDLFLVVLGGHQPSSAAARRAGKAYLADIGSAAGAAADRMVIIDRTLGQREAFELMCAADVAVSVPAADQRSSSVLEAALAGCRLLLSDIAPYREMVGDGLAADLLAEPVAGSLADALRRVRPDEAAGLANSGFILAHERGADKVAALVGIYRELAR